MNVLDPRKRKEYRDRYYSQVPSSPNGGSPWTSKEIEAVVAEDRPCDAELARELGRSIEAVQVARHKMIHGKLHTDNERNSGPRSGHRTKAPEIVPSATTCPSCYCIHPGEC